MNHYFRTIFCYPNGEEEISDEKHETEQGAIWEGEEDLDGWSTGAEVLQLAGEDYDDGEAHFDIEEVWEDNDGNFEKSERWRYI